MIWLVLSPERMGLKNRLFRMSRGNRLRSVIFLGLGLIFWLGIFFLFVHALRMFIQVEIFGPYLVRKLLSILLLALLTLSTFSNLISALSTYYLSEDLSLINSLPLSIREIHLSRFVITFLSSSWMMILFGLPVFLAYGVVYGAQWFYYAILPLFLIPFLAIPTGIGVVLATLLVNLFPARRTKELMVVVSMVFVVGLFVLLRVVQPEKLVDAASFSDVMTFLGEIQSPAAPWLPSRWGVEVLMPLLSGEPGRPAYYLLLTALSGAVAVILSEWVNLALYWSGWTRAQQSSKAIDRRPGWGDRLLERMCEPLPAAMRAIVVKDIKTFFRDAAEWPQLLLILALVAVYLYSIEVLPLDGPFITARIHHIVSFLNLAMVGFVVSSIAVRFLFTSVSVEGRAFWLLRAAPMNPSRFLLAKYLVGCPILLILGLILVVTSNLILGVRPFFMGLGVVTIVALSFSLAGLSIGIGALFPNFKAENVARIAAGPGGILFMIVAQVFVGIILLLEAFPIFLMVRADFRDRALVAWEWGCIAVAIALVIVLSVAGALIPLRRGAKALEALS